jgi:branched-chain amino acid transport system ATP-binding protein
MLKIDALAGGWGQTVINESVSLEIADGQCVALVGRNGVGKSTLLELITGRARQHGGSIRLNGTDISKLATHRRARLGIGYVPQNREVFPSLTVHEHLTIGVRPGRWTVASALELFPSLGRRLQNLGGQLSGGEQQMLAIARALVGNPQLLLMDEPSEGLAPIIVEMLTDVIRSLISSGDFSMLVVEQRVDVALALSSRCLFMDRGRITHEALSEDVRNGRVNVNELMGLEQHSDDFASV